MRRSDYVDRDENYDPHDVDEVPVDAWNLYPKVILLLRPEMPPPGPDIGEGEQQQPNKDVGTVKAGEAEED